MNKKQLFIVILALTLSMILVGWLSLFTGVFRRAGSLEPGTRQRIRDHTVLVHERRDDGRHLRRQWIKLQRHEADGGSGRRLHSLLAGPRSRSRRQRRPCLAPHAEHLGIRTGGRLHRGVRR